MDELRISLVYCGEDAIIQKNSEGDVYHTIKNVSNLYRSPTQVVKKEGLAGHTSIVRALEKAAQIKMEFLKDQDLPKKKQCYTYLMTNGQTTTLRNEKGFEFEKKREALLNALNLTLVSFARTAERRWMVYEQTRQASFKMEHLQFSSNPVILEESSYQHLPKTSILKMYDRNGYITNPKISQILRSIEKQIT